MPTQAPGSLTASRVAVLPDGAVAEAVIAESAEPYAVKRTDAYARWFSDGAWSPWWLVAENVSDISIAPDLGQQDEPAALISVVIWVPALVGAIAANHGSQSHRSEFRRLTASGVVPEDLQRHPGRNGA